MRAACVAAGAVAAGCVFGEPEGASQLWPPTLGGLVEAVVSGDLDADGAEEVVVFASGNDNQAGMYYLHGEDDIHYNTGNAVRAFSRFVPTAFERPIGAFYVRGAAPRIFVAHGTDRLKLTVLTNTLAEEGTGEATIAPTTAPPWARPVTFPGNMVHPAVSNGSNIEHFANAASLTEPRPIPAHMSPTWNGAQLAYAYMSGADQKVVVATTDAIYRATIPTMPGTMFMYESVRSTMEPWYGQTLYDFDGDGRDEVVGYDVAGHRLCVVDVGLATLPATPSCVPTMSTFPGNDVSIFVGKTLSQNPGLDIFIAQSNPNETLYTLIEDFTYNPTSRELSAAMTRSIPNAGPPRGRTVVINQGASTPHIPLTFGTDGQVVCVIGPC